MGLDIELAEKEMNLLVNGFENGMREGKEGKYDDAINSLNMVLISAGRIMGRDAKVGRALKLDKIMLIAKGYQLKAYMEKLRSEQWNKKYIYKKMKEITRGEIDEQRNPYAAEIFSAMEEWANHLGKLLSA